MLKRFVSMLPFACAFAGIAAGCSSSAPADVVTPKAPTAGEALGEATCEPGLGYREPLVVDWTASQRADLEIAMKNGVAILHYDCDEMALLKRCHIAGSYAFTSVTPKQEVVQLVSQQELLANMPMSFASLQGELSAGSSIDLAVALVGKRGTPRMEVVREQLVGECEGATHFVSAALVGAFAMDRGSAGHTRAAASLFSAEVGASSTSSRSIQQRDGDVNACNHVASTSEEPPSRCGTPIRLELVPVVDTPAAPSAKTGPVPVPDPCPPGLSLSQGKCTESVEDAPRLCFETNVDDCRVQCSRENGPSCLRLGNYLRYPTIYGLKNDPVPDEAITAYRKACRLDEAEGCVVSEQTARACELGSAMGCLLEAEHLIVEGDLTQADEVTDASEYATLLRRACSLGKLHSCGYIGRALLLGKIFPADFEQGLKLYEFGCQNGENNLCRALGAMLTQSSRAMTDQRLKPIVLPTKDVRRGLSAWETGCSQMSGGWQCLLAADVYAKGEGVPKDLGKAQKLWDQGCNRTAGRAYLCAHMSRPE